MDFEQRRVVAGRYRLLSPLGHGGMGTVWRARDELLGREVAVKEVTFPHGLSDEDREVLRERTRREARAAARLDHPSAVTVYDVVEEDGSPYLVMELVEARTLSQVVRSDGPLSPQRTAQVGLALLGALETAHRQGIVHRDVKPGNVLLGPPQAGAPGRVVLTDFGIASSVGDPSITSTGLLLGSPSYIAPERARGQTPAPPSDLWSLGATLFTAVEGRPPYDGGDPMTTVTAVVTGEHEPFVAAGPLVPVLEGLLERDPERRLDAASARAALTAVASAAPAAAPSAPAPEPERERHAERTTALPVRELRVATAAADDLPGAGSSAGGTTVAPPREAPPAPRVLDEPRRRSASRLPLVLAALVLLVGTGVGVLALAELDPTDDPRSRPAASPGAGTDGDAAPADPLDDEPLPVGWTRYVADAGWSVGVPPGYVQSFRNGLVQLRNPETRRTLRVRTSDSTADPLDTAQAFSNGLASQLGQYREIRLSPADQGGEEAAELEFTYFDQTDLRVLYRTFVAGGTTYGLWWQVNASDHDDALPLFEQVAETFRPAG